MQSVLQQVLLRVQDLATLGQAASTSSSFELLQTTDDFDDNERGLMQPERFDQLVGDVYVELYCFLGNTDGVPAVNKHAQLRMGLPFTTNNISVGNATELAGHPWEGTIRNVSVVSSYFRYVYSSEISAMYDHNHVPLSYFVLLK